MPTQAIAGRVPAPTPSTAKETIRDGFTDLRARAETARAAATATRADLRNSQNHAEFQGQLMRRYLMSKYTLDTTEEDGRVKAAISGTFNMMVAAAVTLIVGIYVFSQIASTMPTPENDSLANATETVQTTTGDAFTLGAVAVIVLVAALILSLIGGIGGNGGRQGGRRR